MHQASACALNTAIRRRLTI